MHGYRALEGTFLGGCLFSGRVAGRAAARRSRRTTAAIRGRASAPWRLSSRIDPKRAKADLIVARVAARQHGVISLAQLAKAGITPTMVRRRLEAGRLHRVHRGVYAVGTPALTREGRWMAAVLACGPEAVLSHASAAALWSISPTSPSWAHLTVPGNGGRRRRKGIVLHRSTTLTPTDVTVRRGIPVTAHARTLRDCGFGPEPTRSDLERLFVKLCRRHHLPEAGVQRRDRAPHRRRPLASRAPRRRGRQLGLPPLPSVLRVRPRPRPRPAASRLRRPALRGPRDLGPAGRPSQPHYSRS